LGVTQRVAFDLDAEPLERVDHGRYPTDLTNAQ